MQFNTGQLENMEILIDSLVTQQPKISCLHDNVLLDIFCVVSDMSYPSSQHFALHLSDAWI